MDTQRPIITWYNTRTVEVEFVTTLQIDPTNRSAHLTPLHADLIRLLYAWGGHTYDDLAERFGTPVTTIRRIVHQRFRTDSPHVAEGLGG